MASDNTLGAPTEGLGQTVTFAASGGASAPQAGSSNRQAVRNDFRGGQANRANVAQITPVKQDPTTALLFKMGEAIIGPKLEEERTAKYMEGMQAVAEGQVVADIVAEQPWYSKMFGATPLVDGARAYTAFTRTQEVSTAFETEMPELRKLSAKEFAAEATRRVMAAKTGDPTTDMMVMGQLNKSLPQKMATQAKQHYLYQQETLVKSQRNALGAAMAHAKVLGTKYRATDASAVPGDAYMPGAENTDRGEQLSAQLAVVEAAQRPEGMDPQLYSRNLTEAVQLSLAEGNLDGAYTLLDAGVFSALEPDHQQALTRAVEQAERKLRVEFPDALVQDIADFKNAEYTDTPEEIQARAAALNAKYAKLTGARQSLLGGGDISMTLAQQQRVQMQETARLAREYKVAKTAADKDAAKAALILHGAALLASGNVPAGLKPEEQQAAMDQVRARGGAKYWNAVALASTHMKHKVLEDSLNLNIGHAVANTNAEAMHRIYTEQYLPLVQASGARGTVVADSYVSQEFRDGMLRYHNFRQSRVGKDADTEETRVMAMQAVLSPPPKPLGDTGIDSEIKAAAKTGMAMRSIKYLFGGKDQVAMSGLVEQNLAAYLAPQIKTNAAGRSIDEAFDLALNERRRVNLTVLGGAFWERGPGETDAHKWLAESGTDLTPDEVNRATRLAFDKTLEAQGLRDGGEVVQIPDRNGVPSLMVMGIDSEGSPRWAIVTGETIRQTWATREQFKDPVKTPMRDTRGVGKSALEQALEAKQRREAKP